LVDSGKLVTVREGDLRHLPDDLRYRNAFSHCVRLAGIRPTGGTDKWTATSIEALKKIVDYQPHVDVSIEVNAL
jgi:hypothetical protein